MNLHKDNKILITMKFCPACRNMLYAVDEKANDDGDKFAVLSCRKCDYTEPLSRDSPVVYEHILQEDKSERLALNPYLKFDPTLPRFSEIVCPEKDCPSKRGKKNDVVGVKLDAKDLVWMYQCVLCDTTWKQSARAE
uniref:DNA-directed RNA polymerase II subunit RPB9-like zinc ribbon domain-containing protein n=1 Tax=viral metagenome TaxID=1070528 RepID=A0A6C0CUY1_9ZZZZ